MDGGSPFRARFGVERNGETLLAEGSYTEGSELTDGYPEFTMAVLKKLGWDRDLTPEELAVIERIGERHRQGVVVDRPFRRHPARRAQPWLPSLRQRQGAGGRLEPAGSGAGPSRADLYAEGGSGREISDLSRRQAVPAAEHRVQRAEGGGGQGHRQGLPDHPDLRPARRVRGRRRGDAVEPMAGRAAAGDVRRDQPRRRLRARHRRRRLGLGERRGEQLARRG